MESWRATGRQRELADGRPPLQRRGEAARQQQQQQLQRQQEDQQKEYIAQQAHLVDTLVQEVDALKKSNNTLRGIAAKQRELIESQAAQLRVQADLLQAQGPTSSPTIKKGFKRALGGRDPSKGVSKSAAMKVAKAKSKGKGKGAGSSKHLPPMLRSRVLAACRRMRR